MNTPHSKRFAKLEDFLAVAPALGVRVALAPLSEPRTAERKLEDVVTDAEQAAVLGAVY